MHACERSSSLPPQARATPGWVLLACALAALACRGGNPGEIEMKVTRNGFEPALVRVEKGKPVTLVVTRTTDETCATEIVISEAKVNAPLPLGQPVRVTFTPERAGRLRYACAMGMFAGVIEVR